MNNTEKQQKQPPKTNNPCKPGKTKEEARKKPSGTKGLAPPNPRIPSGHVFSIDPGGNILFAVVSDSPESVPILLKNPLRPQDLDIIKANLAAGGCARDEEDRRMSEYAEDIFLYIMDLCSLWDIKEIATGIRMIRNPYEISDSVGMNDPVLALEIDVISRLKLRSRRFGILCHIVDEKNTTKVNAITGGSKGTSSKSTLSMNQKKKMSVHKDINAAMNIGCKVFGKAYVKRVEKLVKEKNAVVKIIPYPEARGEIPQQEDTFLRPAEFLPVLFPGEIPETPDEAAERER